MVDPLNKLKRRLLLIREAARDYKKTIPDMADRFECEEVTIVRDMAALRKIGIKIHSTRLYGISIYDPPDVTEEIESINRIAKFFTR